MRVLFVCKRAPQGRDLVERPYGRFYNLPIELAKRGHQVCVVLLGHRGEIEVEAERDGVRWVALQMSPALWHTYGKISQIVRLFCADWLVACSDAWVAVLAERIAQTEGVRLAVDAYDDYESYMAWNIPLHLAYRRAISKAVAVTAAGPHLAEHMGRCSTVAPVVVPMAADSGFVPIDRDACRSDLGLPPQLPLIGYSGGWAKRRGTELIIPAFEEVARSRPDVRLVLTGKPPRSAVTRPGVVSLGYVADAMLPRVVNAMNVVLVLTADSRFGRCSYPSKLCEAMACDAPVVATATKPVRWMLSDRSQCLVPVGDPLELASRVLRALEVGRIDYGSIPSWRDSAAAFEAALSQ